MAESLDSSDDLCEELTSGLFRAAQAGDESAVEFYIGAGASLDDALMYATAHGHLAVVTELVRHGADVNCRSVGDFGMTPLMIAADSDCVDVVAELIRLGADMDLVDDRGTTATLRALAYQHLDVVAELVRHGADVDIRDRLGRTALGNAVAMGSKAAVDIVTRSSAFDSSSCPTPDEVALFAAAVMGDTCSLRTLTAKGVDVECAGRDGRTALFYAAEYGQLSAVQHLLESGANIAARSRTSETPLMLAGRAGHMPTLQALVQAGAPVNVRSRVDGETPLISAAQSDFFPAVQLLIAHGGDALAVDDVRDDEYPLVLGSLETLGALCATAAFEFDSVCGRMLKQLQCVHSQLQHRRQSQHGAAPEAALVSRGAVVTFASILFRACRVLFGIAKKSLVLSRFTASRAIMERIYSVQDELSHFADMLHLEQDGAVTRGQHETDEDELHERFEQALSTNDALTDGCDFTQRDDISDYERGNDSSDDYDVVDRDDEHDRRYELALLLQYELAARQREQNARAQAVVQRVLQRFLQACKMAKAPVVPPWFISPDDLEYHSWNMKRLRGRVLAHFRGKWRSANVTIEITRDDPDDLQSAIAQWYLLSHPNVARVYGACHVGGVKVIVYETVPDAVLLRDFLADDASEKLVWRSLYQVALGLQYLHDRGVDHGCCFHNAVVVGSDHVPKLTFRTGIWWESPEDESKWFPASEDLTPEADVYSFGLCIWAVLHGGQLTGQDAAQFISGDPPARPTHMTESAYDLILRMCARDPSDRVRVAVVVNQLKQFADASEKLVGRCSPSALAKIQSQHLDDYAFPALGSHSIPSALVHVMTRCEDLPDTQWILTRVLPALEFAFGLLHKCGKTPVDAEVTAYCVALARLQRYVETHLSPKSVYEQMRSRQVAKSHHLVYTELDELLDMLDVEPTDPIRTWRFEAAPSIVNPVALADGPVEGLTTDATKRKADPSESISLCYMDTQPALYAQWTRDGLATAASSSPLAADGTPERPSWYLSLRHLSFSESSDQIGQGAFGAVYRGSWRGTPVVIKFMGFEEDIETISTDLLLHEVRVWHRLNHPHVLKLYGASHVDKRYFVCEFAGNGELRAYLKTMKMKQQRDLTQQGQEPNNNQEQQVTDFNDQLTWQKLYEAALGLQYLHDVNVAHNDLKCNNIMVGSDHKAKLIDFGLSCLIGEAEIQVDVKKIGAVNWRSPEYLAGGRPSFASDVYSFAMCIIEAVSGEPPWGRNPVQAGQVRFWLRRGMSPPLPASMTSKQRHLIALMTKLEPSERVSMAFVVAKLEEIAQDARASAAP